LKSAFYLSKNDAVKVRIAICEKDIYEIRNFKVT